MQNELLFTGGRKNFEISVWLRKKKNTFSHHNIITSSPPPMLRKKEIWSMSLKEVLFLIEGKKFFLRDNSIFNHQKKQNRLLFPSPKNQPI